jgi:peptidoglycan/LPS O-acetylase OafA/YrhL
MGAFPLTLAMSVMFSHLGLGFLIGGTLAVEIFFMLSGFLVSYILVETKSYKTKQAFLL